MGEKVGPRQMTVYSCLSCIKCSLQDGDYVCLHPQAPWMLIGNTWTTPQWCPVAPWNQKDAERVEVPR